MGFSTKSQDYSKLLYEKANEPSQLKQNWK